MRKQGVSVDVIRPVDHDIATGVYTDMREHGCTKGICASTARRTPSRSVDPDLHWGSRRAGRTGEMRQPWLRERALLLS